MKTCKKRIEPHEVIYDEHEFCDWCGKEIEPPGYSETNEFRLEWRVGKNLGTDGIWGDKKEVDLCNDCRERLFSYLKDNGCKVQESEYDY